jgi:SAM-dependent methyltransferase
MLTIPTKILPKNILDAVKRTRPVYNTARSMRFALGTRLGARAVPGIRGRVHFNDFMLTSAGPADVESYLRGARQFVAILQRSYAEAGRDWSAIDAVLEVGCGYGRIVRELTTAMPASRLYVSDVIDDAAAFTAREFGSHKVPVLEQAGSQLESRFDLIYLLSVYTHLRRDMVAANLRRVAASLKPNGVAVLTVHGQGSAETAERYEQYWLDKTRLLDALARDGYYYEKYPYYYSDYGLTWFTRSTFEGLVAETVPELALIAYHPMDVDGHQDVFVYRKI